MLGQEQPRWRRKRQRQREQPRAARAASDFGCPRRQCGSGRGVSAGTATAASTVAEELAGVSRNSGRGSCVRGSGDLWERPRWGRQPGGAAARAAGAGSAAALGT